MRCHSDVINAFGGIKPLAVAIGVDPRRATHWARRGIPSKYWPRVETAAQARAIAITTHDLMRLSPQLADAA